MVIGTIQKAGAAAIAALLLVVWLGYAYYSRRVDELERQIMAMRIEAQEAEIAAMSLQREIEHEWQAKADEAARTAAAGVADVEAAYEQSITDLYAVLAARDSRVPDHPAGSDTSALPAASGATGSAAQPTACKCRESSRGNLERLSRDIMTLARDCDLNDRYLREWITFYEGVRQGGP